jgi:hypothetical protein
MAVWSRDHVTTIGFQKSWFLEVSCGAWLIEDRTGPLGGKRRTVGWEGRGE